MALLTLGAAPPLASAAAGPAPGSLRFLASYADGIDGGNEIGGISGVATSPDSRHVYVTAAEDDAITAFERETDGEGLEFVESDQDGEVEAGTTIDGLDGAADVAVSADGMTVHVASNGDDAVATFARDAGSGELRLIDVERDGSGGVDGIDRANGLAVSPDGGNVYVAGLDDDAIATFSRDLDSGELEFADSLRAPFPETWLDGPYSVSVAPTGAAVYAASFHGYAVVAFSRERADGALSLANVNGAGDVYELEGPVAVAPSPYARDVYSADLRASTLHRFRRSSDQTLAFTGYVADGFAGVDGIAAASGLVVSPDAAGAYATGALDDALAFFTVRDATGGLAFRRAYRQGEGGVDGLDGAAGLAVAPDGRRIYAVANGEAGDTLAVFARRRVPVLERASAPARQHLGALHATVRCSRSCTLRAKAQGKAGELQFASGRLTRKLTDDRNYRIELRFHRSVLRELRGEPGRVGIELRAHDRLDNSEALTLRVEVGT